VQESTEQGPQIDQKQMQTILGYISSGKAEGARLLAGGKRYDEEMKAMSNHLKFWSF
jgi:acyl-CoA reductase-like NAD-dependent aldehyde dehydrogenase